jgi:hypothetical protein
VQPWQVALGLGFTVLALGYLGRVAKQVPSFVPPVEGQHKVQIAVTDLHWFAFAIQHAQVLSCKLVYYCVIADKSCSKLWVWRNIHCFCVGRAGTGRGGGGIGNFLTEAAEAKCLRRQELLPFGHQQSDVRVNMPEKADKV